jgi:hypothetical protein
MMGIQPRKPHDEIGLVRIEILPHDLLVRCEILRVQIPELLITGILDRLVIPFSAVTGTRTKDDTYTRISKLSITRDDRCVVLSDVDDGDMSKRANPRILDTGSSQNIRMKRAAEPVDSPSLFQDAKRNTEPCILPPLLQDIMVWYPGILKKILQDILLFNEYLHLMAMGHQSRDCVLVIMEMSRVAEIN